MFPALIGLVVWADFAMMRDEFGNYGLMVLIGVIIAALMALIYYIAFIINVALGRKKRKKRKPMPHNGYYV